MNRPGVLQVPEGSGERGKMEEKKNWCKIICDAPVTLVVKGLMIMIMVMMMMMMSMMKRSNMQCFTLLTPGVA